MPDNEDLLYIGPDVASDLLPTVSRAHLMSRPVDERVRPFGTGHPAAEELDSRDSEVWSAFDQVDVAMHDHLSRLTEMMPWVVSQLTETDADGGRDIASAGDGGG